MNVTTKRKFLVVGLGSVGRQHVENLLSLGVGHVEVCSEWRHLAEFRVGGVSLPVFHDYTAALDARPAAVVIANPTNLHATYSLRALERGCHVYVEKPVAISAEEALPLAELARERKVTVAVGCQFRFNTCLERLKSLLGESKLGRIVHVHACMGEYLPDYHPHEDYRSSYAARSELGGGVMLTQIHDINYVRWLFGPFDSVYATGGKTSDLQIDVEDNVAILLRTSSGTGISVHMDYLQRPRRRSVAIVGEDASAC